MEVELATVHGHLEGQQGHLEVTAEWRPDQVEVKVEEEDVTEGVVDADESDLGTATRWLTREEYRLHREHSLDDLKRVNSKLQDRKVHP